MNTLAILCSDVHLCHFAPIARSAELDWYEAMRRPLNEMRLLTEKFSCPLIIAGDVFDKWNSPPELINFAIDEFGQFQHGVYCIPGQHDLPGHNYEESYRSAYGSLTRSKVVTDVEGGNWAVLPGGLCLHSFPWGFPVQPLSDERIKEFAKEFDVKVHLAVVHAYIWKAGCSYPGADENKLVANVKESLKGYTSAVFGDNHIGFLAGKILNNGGLMRRKIDEIDYQPSVGILTEGGIITRHQLNCSLDVFIDREKYLDIEAEELDFSAYIEELKEIGVATLDFREELTRRMEISKTDAGVKSIILSLLD